MKIIAGVDEVGRGSLIGPVYAAAVILNKSINKKLLKDSKKLTKSKREILAKHIKKNSRLNKYEKRPVSGAPARIRTADLLITNQLLYQLSYKGLKCFLLCILILSSYFFLLVYMMKYNCSTI